MVGIVRYRPPVCKERHGYSRTVATQAERRARTRTTILDAARAHFIDTGYSDTSVATILDTAGVSRGAMYHHFASKEEVFAAVFVQTANDAIRSAAARVDPTLGPHDRLVAGCLAWLDVVSDRPTGQLLFTQGPIALGWQRCRTLEEATSLGVVRASLRAAVDADEIEVESIDSTARLINALLAEAALLRCTTPSGDARAIASDVTTLLGGLRRRAAPPHTRQV